MWIHNLRQFLNHSLQRIGQWARGVGHLPAHLFQRGQVSAGESLPGRQMTGYGKTGLVLGALPDNFQMDLSYRFRSLHCHMRVGVCEPTPGMQLIYRALQGTGEP